MSERTPAEEITIAATPDGDSHAPSSLAVVGWAVFLACSWTWCIGMFLPIILLRDFGYASFLVFAIPNVVGAAAMGWMVRSSAHSRAMVAAHLPVMRLFSLVTFAFQAVFLLIIVWPLEALVGRGALAFQLLVFVAVIVGLMRARGHLPHRSSERGAWFTAAVVFAVSLGCFAAWIIAGGPASVPGFDRSTAFAASTADLGRPRLETLQLAALAPVCLMGFLFSPYLDLSFHRARTALAGAGKKGFALGFGVFFFVMILFTLSYAALFWPRHVWDAPKPPTLAVGAIVLHLTLQCVFTMLVHEEEFSVRRGGDARKDADSAASDDVDGSATPKTARHPLWTLVPAALLAIGAVIVFAQGRGAVGLPVSMAPPDSDRVDWYRVFMSFYGLIFPAYVWLCVLPTWNLIARGGGMQQEAGIWNDTEREFAIRAAAPTRRQIVVWLSCCAIASPAFYLGFIEGRTWWLLGGVGVVLIARLFIGPTGQRLEPKA
jgi:hypothetical protein